MKCRLECNDCGHKWIETAKIALKELSGVVYSKNCRKRFCECCKKISCPRCDSNKISIWSEISE